MEKTSESGSRAKVSDTAPPVTTGLGQITTFLSLFFHQKMRTKHLIHRVSVKIK